MAELQTFGVADWPEKALKNVTNPNSGELSRADYYTPNSVNAVQNGFKSCVRGHVVISDGTVRYGFAANGFVNDFYNRIHLSPTLIDAGLLTTNTDYLITLWNGYLNTPVLISDVNFSQQGGIELDKTPPLTLMPLADIIITLTLTTSGPPTQDTDVTFTTNVGDVGLHVTASRIVLFGFEPNWQGGFNLKITFGTIITARGRQKEQRRAKSPYPTFKLAFSIWEPKQKGRDLAARLETAFDRILAVPVYCAGETNIKMLSAKSVQLKPFANNWFLLRWAKMATLFDYKNDRQQVLNISAKDAALGVLSFTQDIMLEQIDALYPCMPAYLEPVTLSRKTNDLTQVKVSFNGYVDGPDPLADVPALPATFPFKFNFNQSLSHSFDTARALAGFDAGVQTMSPLIDFALNKFGGQVSAFGKQAEFELLDFFAAAQGRRFAFKFNHPAVVFEVARDYMPGQTVVTVKGEQDTVLNRRRPLPFWYKDYKGVDTTVTLIQVEPRGDGTSDLYFSGPFPYAIKAGAVMGRIYTVRLDNDVLDLDYVTSTAAQAKLTFKEVLE